MSRLGLTLILAWTLLLLPALCTGGVLLHPCDCGSTVSCEHETDCDADPCEIGMARSDSWSQSLDDSGEQAANASAAFDSPWNRPRPAREAQRPSPSPLAFVKALPFPPTDLPRLN